MSLVGFQGEKCKPDVEGHPRVHRFNVVQPFVGWSRKLFLLYAPLKVLWQVGVVLNGGMRLPPLPSLCLCTSCCGWFLHSRVAVSMS